MKELFVNGVGYALGILIVLVISGVFLKPIKFILKLLLNSALGLAFLVLVNFLAAPVGIHIGINPVTAIAVGALGIPGVIIILILQIFY